MKTLGAIPMLYSCWRFSNNIFDSLTWIAPVHSLNPTAPILLACYNNRRSKQKIYYILKLLSNI